MQHVRNTNERVATSTATSKRGSFCLLSYYRAVQSVCVLQQ